MADQFDFIVVGKGMMGAAAARHLAQSGARIALVGPDEPADWASHDGVYSSHYDNGRITRTIDDDPVWARLASQSITRYRDIEREAGIDFYHEVGCLISGPDPKGDGGFLDGVVDVAKRQALDAPLLPRQTLADRFPWFGLPSTSAGIFEARGAGHVNPRALVEAQTVCAEKSGAAVIREEAVSVEDGADGVTVTLRSGRMLAADRVLVAAGGFSVADGLLPRRIDLVVKARTVLLAEIADEDLAGYAAMPSWIDESGDPSEHFYMLPPIPYADGRHYLKIGGDPTDIVLPDMTAILDWFKTDGDAGAIAHLRRMLAKSVPDLRPVSLVTKPCVTTYTRHGYPYAGFVAGDRIGVLTGGNGAAAKSSDEIGRLGASLLLDGQPDADAYETDFAVHFA